MNRYKSQGWKNDNYRHSLAARGYRTSLKAIRGANFVTSDIPLSFKKSGIDYPDAWIDRYGTTHKGSPKIKMLEAPGNDNYPSSVSREDLAHQDILDELYGKKRGLMSPDKKRGLMSPDKKRGLMSPEDISRLEAMNLELKNKSYGDYDEYLKSKEMEDLKIMDADIKDAQEAMDDMKARKDHLKHLEEMEIEGSSVSGRDAFAALDHRKFHKIQAKGSRTLQSV